MGLLETLATLHAWTTTGYATIGTSATAPNSIGGDSDNTGL